MAKANLSIQGMSCGNCVSHVKKALEALSGVHAESVEIGSATVTYDPEATDLPQIQKALEEEGYPASAVAEA
ncbi:MAG: heavy metal-associated domain-containing protein [Gemmatimonadota bacterium]